MIFSLFKGAVAYELKIGRAYIYICHLSGEYWAWRPWRRFACGWDKE